MKFYRESSILKFQEFAEIFRPLSTDLNQSVNSKTESCIPVFDCIN
jgi:hypothetical protein